jgi:tetratricopeptide (TPR) repeat protein
MELLEQVRDTFVEKLGPNHPSTLSTRNNLALAYQAAGKLPKAIELLEHVRDAQVKQLGADHPRTLTTLNNLASAYFADGKPEQALPLFEQAAEGVEKRKFQHEHAWRIVGNLIAYHEERKQYAEAGKTHVATALAIEACHRGYRVLELDPYHSERCTFHLCPLAERTRY